MRSDSLTPAESRRVMRQMLLAGLSGAAVIVLGKLTFIPWLGRYLASPDPAVAALHFTRFMEGFAAFLVLLALWLASYAWRIFRSGQVPPPGAGTLWRAPRTGLEAKRAGVVVMLGAAALAALAVFALRIPGRVIAARAARMGAPR